MSSTLTPAQARTRGGVRGTYAAFILSGLAFATWASRIPQVRDRLQLSPAQVGAVLLSIAVGSLVALPLSGMIIHRFGSRRTLATLAVVDGAAMGLVAVGYRIGLVPRVLGLVAFGFAQGGWDVAMNVQGAAVERRLGRAVMSRFHAGFSVGTVGGALLGAVMVALAVPVTAHLLGVAVLVGVLTPYAVRGFVPDTDDRPDSQTTHGTQDAHGSARPGEARPTSGQDGGGDRSLRAWREPRTLLVGLFVLTFAFAEGTGNDWAGLALIDGYRASAAVGTLGFALFLSAMTAGRWFGPGLLDRFGRVLVVRALSGVCLLGVLLFVFGRAPAVAFVGAVLWGAGLSLGFPVGMSAAADQPAMAPARVSVVASLGYCAFLAGPPLVGFLGDRFGVLRAITAVAVTLAVGLLVSGSVRPPGPAGSVQAEQ